MSQKTISSEEEVLNFLKEIKEILTNPRFNPSKDLDILMKKKNESPIDPYTTENTMLALDFDKHDVLNQLLSLNLSEYMETFIDDMDNSLPPFFAFVKEIKNKDIYIKAKIRDRQHCKVFCVSFHFARYPLPKNLPYG